jgi:uncharacterized membrane protein YphA (DoxX/SURF4 family)
MGWLGTAAAIVLASAFVWAAIAKLGDRAGTEAAFRRMGLPGAGALAIAVPAIELTVAAALLASPRVGGAGALVILSAMTVVLIGVIASGRGAPCPCFGARRLTPVGPRDVLRNLALMALAIVAAVVS